MYNKHRKQFRVRNSFKTASKLGLLVAAASLLTAAPPQQQTAANPNRALLDRYCVGCHNQRLKTAKLEMDVMDIAHPEKDAVVWERAIRKLRGGMMPPPGAAKPTAEIGRAHV